MWSRSSYAQLHSDSTGRPAEWCVAGPAFIIISRRRRLEHRNQQEADEPRPEETETVTMTPPNLLRLCLHRLLTRSFPHVYVVVFRCTHVWSALHRLQPNKHRMSLLVRSVRRRHKQLVPHVLIREWLTGRTSFQPCRLDHAPSRLLILPGTAFSADRSISCSVYWEYSPPVAVTRLWWLLWLVCYW